MTVGTDLRTLRKARALRLVDLAATMGRSVGWMSQVERDLSRLSECDLEKLAVALAVAPSILRQPRAGDDAEAGRIVRAGARRAVGRRHDGLIETLISPDLTDSFETLHATFLPGHRRDVEIRRPSQELGFVLSGRLDLWIDGWDFTVGPGDSFRIRDEPYRWANPYPEPAVTLWTISPPIY